MTLFTTADLSHRAQGASAVISENGLYRYQLGRIWDSEAAPMTFCMLNPSVADGEKDDQTIRKCIAIAKREGAGGIIVVNLFAYRATEPADLRAAAEAHIWINGPENSRYVEQALREAKRLSAPVVVAWGASWPFARLNESVAHSRFFATWNDCLQWDTKCLGWTKDGSPRHPCRLGADTPLQLWPRARNEETS